MAPEKKPGDRRLSTPLVLALASGMISVGVVAYLGSRPTPEPSPAPRPATTAEVDRSTPAGTAESFLDAWRKRDHETALALSTGEARREVIERRDREAAQASETQDLKARIWDALARDRLAFEVESDEAPNDDARTLRGVARGVFMNAEYARRIEFDLEREGGAWTVSAMRLGTVLTDTPDFLRLAGESGR